MDTLLNTIGLSERWMALFIIVFALIVLTTAVWFAFRRASLSVSKASEVLGPCGPGAALVMALDGDLVRARSLLEAHLRVPGQDAEDTLFALIGVLRSSGELNRAMLLADQWATRHPSLWMHALQTRLALDNGDFDKASRLAAQNDHLPTDIAVAVAGRSGRWLDALEIYRRRTSRAARGSTLEANLAAAAAAEHHRDGRGRAARKLIKKAVALDESGLVVQLVGQYLHPKDIERAALRTELRKRLPGAPIAGLDAESSDSLGRALSMASAAEQAGDEERALSVLRAYLDEVPEAIEVRQAFSRLLVSHGASQDWRDALLEWSSPAAMRSLPDDSKWQGWCARCGLATVSVVIICPRCDAVGALSNTPPRVQQGGLVFEEAIGTTLVGLVPPEGHATD